MCQNQDGDSDTRKQAPALSSLQVLLKALQPSHCAGCVESDALAQGPGLCHGVSGNGYALLSAYKHTKDARYLVRATRFAMWLTEHWQQLYGHADRPLSLFEVGEVIFADLFLCLMEAARIKKADHVLQLCAYLNEDVQVGSCDVLHFMLIFTRQRLNRVPLPLYQKSRISQVYSARANRCSTLPIKDGVWSEKDAWYSRA